MVQTKDGKDELVFTVELKSRGNVKNVALSNGAQGVLIEGTLGALKRAEFVEDVVLEVTGDNGVLRVDLAREDLAKRTRKAEEDEAN
jgi:hypothetical protein